MANEQGETGLAHLGTLQDPDLWAAAYKKLAPSPGSMTRGGDQQTIDGSSMKQLRQLQEWVLSGQFRFGLSRRVMIPKPKGGQRPLGIPTRDRIVQEVIRSILERIYEPTFSPQSHGFRPGRSQHTALKQIRLNFSAAWFLEGDI